MISAIITFYKHAVKNMVTLVMFRFAALVAHLIKKINNMYIILKKYIGKEEHICHIY
jgi:hypothetical protein